MKHPGWSVGEDALIRSHIDLTDEELALMLDRTYEATKNRRYMLCGPRDAPTMVKPTDEQHMVRWRQEIYGV